MLDSWYHAEELTHISIIKKIEIGDIEIMTSAYGSSGSFGSRVRSKSFGHKKYTRR